ncbi:unnamed protein product [Prunus armeniaca]
MAPALVDYTTAEKELYEFDDLKIGVKSLVDAGVTHIPRFFIQPPECRANNSSTPQNRVLASFKSVKHRVLATPLGKPRISAVSFFLPCSKVRLKPCGPIKELLSDISPPIYRITSYEEVMNHYRVVGQIGGGALPHFKL